MSLLHSYSGYLKTGDANGMARLFAQDGEFYDDAPSKLGLQPIAVKGRDQIQTFFEQTFQRGGLSVSNVGINGNAMRYDVEVGNMVLLCLGVMREEDSLIKEYRVIAV